MSEERKYQVGDVVVVIAQGDDPDDPPIGTRSRVSQVDDSDVPIRIEWGGGWWMTDAQVRLINPDELAAPARPTPTVLDVYLECLHIIQELPPDERKRVICALKNFKDHSETTLTCELRAKP